MTAGSLVGTDRLTLWAEARNLPSLYTAFVRVGLVRGTATRYGPALPPAIGPLALEARQAVAGNAAHPDKAGTSLCPAKG